MSDPIKDVLKERERQDKKWGPQNHHPERWIIILIEEVGEAGKDLLEGDAFGYRKEMVQVAAVALAAIESFDRAWKKEEEA